MDSQMECVPQDLIFDRSNLRDSRIVPSGVFGNLAPGEVRLNVDRFALTANNVTYGAMGAAFHYWDFFPAPSGWGRIPVWGYADVTETKCAGVNVGDRVYGFLPMSNSWIAAPARVRGHAWADGATHRSGLPPVYNHYIRVESDPLYKVEHEPQRMALGPLFSTSFVLADFLAAHDYFGAEQLLFTSASSKTAIGTAFVLRRLQNPPRKIAAITSQGNADFVNGVGLYDCVSTYQAAELIAQVPTVLVDFSGNRSVVEAVHNRYADRLKHSCAIGATHWDSLESLDADLETAGKGLAGPRHTMFHAPNQIHKRQKEWGAEAYMQLYAGHWQDYADQSQVWFEFEDAHGLSAAQATFNAFLDGQTRPQSAYIFNL